MAPCKGPPTAATAALYSRLESSLEANCASVLDAAVGEIGVTVLPLITGIVSKQDLWTILYKYKTVCPSLENRLALLSVLTDFCCCCVVNPAIAHVFLHDSNPRSLHTILDKIGKEWNYVFQAVSSLPKAKRLEEYKIKAVHSIFARWAEMIDSSMINKIKPTAADFCFKEYSLGPVMGGKSTNGIYTAIKDISNTETGEAPVQLNMKFEMKRLCVGSLQLKSGKDQLLQIYIGEEIIIGIQPSGKPEIVIPLKNEYLDGVVVCFGDGESFSDVKDAVFLYPNTLGCSVIMEAMAGIPELSVPPLDLAQGEDRRILGQFRRRVKEEESENVMSLMRLLVGNKVVEVDLEFSEALIAKREKSSRLFSRNTNNARKREREGESLVNNKSAKIIKDVTEVMKDITEGNVRFKCFKCGHGTRDRSGLNVHILTHFLKEFYRKLPNFSCPQCSYKNIDRKGLAYHYAFDHEKILDFVTKDQLEGTLDADSKENVHNMDKRVLATKLQLEHNMSIGINYSDSETMDESYSSLPDINMSKYVESQIIKPFDKDSANILDEDNQGLDKLDIAELFPSLTKQYKQVRSDESVSSPARSMSSNLMRPSSDSEDEENQAASSSGMNDLVSNSMELTLRCSETGSSLPSSPTSKMWSFSSEGSIISGVHPLMICY